MATSTSSPTSMPRSQPATVAARRAPPRVTAASSSEAERFARNRAAIGPRRRRSTMAKQTDKTEAVSKDELESQVGEPLPDREQMSLINANVAAPINAAIALNVLSDGSVAYANAQQTAPISQGNLAPVPPA